MQKLRDQRIQLLQRAIVELIEKRVDSKSSVIEARPGRNGLFKFNNGIICSISTSDLDDSKGLGVEIKPLADGCLDKDGKRVKTKLKVDRIYEAKVC